MGMLRALSVLIAHPELALVPALGFALGFAVTRSRLALTAGLLWLAYGLYEYGMTRRILCSGECNIRIDLLVLYPLLIVVSLAAVARLMAGARGRKP